MKRIGIISDTHSYWDERYRKYFEPCDEIWHAGDICSTELAERLAELDFIDEQNAQIANPDMLSQIVLNTV